MRHDQERPSSSETRIVFWNVNGKNLVHLYPHLVEDTRADVLVLCEGGNPPDATLQALQHSVSGDFFVPVTVVDEATSKFQCFSRNRSLDLSEVHNGERMSVRQLRIGSEFRLLFLIHGVDVRNYDDASRQSAAEGIARQVKYHRSRHSNQPALMVGDFNLNPYDRAMNLAAGFNAMMTRACANKGTRKYLGEVHDFYYNPMWSLFGDGSEGPPGTIFDASSQGPYGWSMFDQVLVHHLLVDEFVRVQILDSAHTTSLVRNDGRPDKQVASDHLPIMVVLKGASRG